MQWAPRRVTTARFSLFMAEGPGPERRNTRLATGRSIELPAIPTRVYNRLGWVFLFEPCSCSQGGQIMRLILGIAIFWLISEAVVIGGDNSQKSPSINVQVMRRFASVKTTGCKVNMELRNDHDFPVWFVWAE